MKSFLTFLRIAMTVMTLLLGIAAIPSGIMLMLNVFAPPVDMLQGSLFKDFTLPGLALTLIIGGSSLLAGILLIKQNKFGSMAAATVGVILMFFEFVEVMIIGSPEGSARAMQIGAFALGTLLMMASLGTWFLQIVGEKKS